jgi:hypothetical protein
MPAVDWESVAKTTLHPLQVSILEHAAASSEDRFSPAQLAVLFDAPLGNVAYHVRVLHARGLLERAGTKPRRGAVEHFYRGSRGLRAG